jgi:type III restriction enzyme
MVARPASNIIAHDKFQEVIAEAAKGDSPIRLKQLQLVPVDAGGSRLVSYSVPSMTEVLLGLADVTATGANGITYKVNLASISGVGADARANYSQGNTIAFQTGEDKQIALVAMDVCAELGRDKSIAPTSAALSSPDLQQRITQMVQQRLVPKQGELLESVLTDSAAIAGVVKKTVDMIVERSIDIPRISVVPIGPVTGGYAPFKLDVSHLKYQPVDTQLLSHGLQSGRQLTYGEAAVGNEARFEDHIVRELINYDDVSYDDHADLIYELAGQAVTHFKSYLADDDATHNVLGTYAKPIAEIIHAQMFKHYVEKSAGSDVVVSQGFVPVKQSRITAPDDVKSLHWSPDDKRTIAQFVYGGFERCTQACQKFQSDTERILATVLERQANSWFRPLSGQFNIYYRFGVNQSEYIPDFVVALDDVILMIETKKAQEVTAAQESETEVKAKADQAILWCKHASDYSKKVGGKPWRYLLIPHDQVAANVTLASLVSKYGM